LFFLFNNYELLIYNEEYHKFDIKKYVQKIHYYNFEKIKKTDIIIRFDIIIIEEIKNKKCFFLRIFDRLD